MLRIRRLFILWLWLVGGLLLLPLRAPQARASAAQRLLLLTPAGDLVLRPFTEQAPRHTAQLLELARAGGLSGMRVESVEKGWAQLRRTSRDLPVSIAEFDRKKGFSLLAPEPTGLAITRGTVVARIKKYGFSEGDTNSDAVGSFAIALSSNAAREDRYYYSVLGEAVDSEEVLRALEGLSTDADGQPERSFLISRAFIVDAAELPARAGAFAPPGEASLPLARNERDLNIHSSTLVLSLAALLMLYGGLVFLFSGRASARTVASAGLLALFSGFFVGFVQAVAAPPRSRWAACLILLGAFSVFRFLGRFESRPRKKGF